jgi:hypothetical protein
MTVTVYLDWRDAYTAGVSILLLLSFWLAFRARNVAATDDRRSMWMFLWSGVLLFIGHSIFLVVGTILSLEGFYIANVGFMLFGLYTASRMALGLRKLRAPTAGEPGGNSRPPDAAPPSQQPVSHATNGHQLPAQRPAPTGSGPWPETPTPASRRRVDGRDNQNRGADPRRAGPGGRCPMSMRIAAVLAAVGLLAAVVGQYGHTLHAARIDGHPVAELPVHEPAPFGVPWITGW